MKRTILVTLLLLAGCNPAQQRLDSLETVTPIKLSKAQMATVRSGVTKTLKDPESARFGDMVAGKNSKGSIVVCGYVNAKNSFGGYTGEKPFTGLLIGPKDRFAVTGMGGDDISTRATMTICNKQGLYL